ncbi:NfeD family protein [Qipengyuania sp.]|uniref:NfeD family protein n=1 Tax=Qipengyuania sp. TaxID=2004515 RepID=UPI0035C7F99A
MDGIEPYWWWFAAGLALAGLEMLVPGVYLVWLALAALATGVLVLAGDPPFLLQIVNFVFLSLIFAYSARRWVREKPIESSDPLLNNRAGRLVGSTAVVTTPLEGGQGRVRVGDGEWMASGPDSPEGARVRISGHIGGVLSVEPLELPPPA